MKQLVLLALGAVVIAAQAGIGQALGQDCVSMTRSSALGSVPLYFEANRGQMAGDYSFIARGRTCSVLIAPAEAALVLCRRQEPSPALSLGRFEVMGHEGLQSHVVRFLLEGANPGAAIAGLQPLAAKANYFIGDDPAQWHEGIPLYPRVQVAEVYAGIGLVYYADESARLEYDFLLQPGARPDLISWRIDGADKIEVDRTGDLVLWIGGEQVRQHAPVIYQAAHGSRNRIDGGYRLKGKGRVGFWVGEYDHAERLVIDPTLSFATYLGGQLTDRGWGIAVDGSGNVWVAGETTSPNLKTTPNAIRRNYQGGNAAFGDGFVAKFTNGTTNLSYLTYLGGSGQDAAFAIAAGTNGEAFITGYTDSPNFPIFPTHGPTLAFQRHLAGTNLNVQGVYPVDAFVTKLNADGTLAYSTYLGGAGRDVGLGIAVDKENRAYVTGYTESGNFPRTNSLEGQYRNVVLLYPTKVNGLTTVTVVAYMTNYDGSKFKGGGDAFITRMSADGSAVEYSSYLGGANEDIGQGIAVDANDSAYVVGTTASPGFPVTNAFTRYIHGQTNGTPIIDGFICKLSPEGTNLEYSSFLGGYARNAAQAVAVDTAANAYITGYTYSTNFPVTLYDVTTSTNIVVNTNTVPPSTNSVVVTNSAFTFTHWTSPTNANSDVFVLKLDSSGSTNGGYSVVFGGKSSDQGTGIAVDENQNAYIVGVTTSRTNFADIVTNNGNQLLLWTNGFSATNTAFARHVTKDAFFVELNPSGSNLFKAYVGGFGNNMANGIALDTRTTPGSPIAYMVGTTGSTNFPGTAPSKIHGNHIYGDAFVARIEGLP